jgi:RNA:NAD 2'-phosphotransferase (TPT1/KptA family)
MSAARHLFYRSENGVWLTDEVPPVYLRRLEETV